MRKGERSERVLTLLADWLLGCVGVFCSLRCLCSAFALSLPELIFLPFFLLFLLILTRLPRAGWIVGAVSAALLLIGYLVRHELSQSAVLLWRELSVHYARGYNFFRNLVPQAETAPEVLSIDTGPALLGLAVLESWLFAVSLGLWRRAWPACLGLLLGVLPCYVLTDTYPDLPPLVGLLFVIIVLLLVQNTRRRQTGELAKASAWMIGAAGVLLAVLLAGFPFQKHFDPPVTWQTLYEQLQRIGDKLDGRGSLPDNYIGTPKDVVLGDLGALPTQPADVMTVRTGYSGLLYLRGSSYNLFDGAGWSMDETDVGERSLLYPWLGASYMEYNLKITPLIGDRIYFTPYQVTKLPDDAALRSDSYLVNPRPSEPYTLRFDPEPEPVYASGSRAEEAYRAYVYETCLALPAETRAGVLAWWMDHGADQAMTIRKNTKAVALWAADRVSRCASYSRNPDRVPAGEDFCTWFLNDAGSGYCVHFATACTALLRALDIPARYVTGYVCETRPGTDVTVTSLQAHAWVEFFDGVCWHVVEPTPGSATEFTGRIPEEPDETATETERVLPSQTSLPTQDFTEPTWPHGGPVRPQPDPNDPDATEPGTDSPAGKGFRIPVSGWIPLILAALIVVLVLRRKLAARLRDARYARADQNGKALLLYRRIKRLHRLTWSTIPEEAKTLAEKAMFSQHELTDGELSAMRRYLDEQLRVAEHAPLGKRLWYRYGLAVI